jgi:hypothetical protein
MGEGVYISLKVVLFCLEMIEMSRMFIVYKGQSACMTTVSIEIVFAVFSGVGRGHIVDS